MLKPLLVVLGAEVGKFGKVFLRVEVYCLKYFAFRTNQERGFEDFASNEKSTTSYANKDLNFNFIRKLNYL